MMVNVKSFFTLKEFSLHHNKFKWVDEEAEMMKAGKSWTHIFRIGTEEDLLAGEIYRVLEKDGSETYYLIEYDVLEGSRKAWGESCKVNCIPRGPVKLGDPIPDKLGFYKIQRNIKKLL